MVRNNIRLTIEILGRFTVWAVVFNYMTYVEHITNFSLIVVSLIFVLWIVNPIVFKEV